MGLEQLEAMVHETVTAGSRSSTVRIGRRWTTCRPSLLDPVPG